MAEVRTTVRVSKIPLIAKAQDLFNLFESLIGQGSVYAVEIFTERKNWKSKGHGRVQFETLEGKAKAIELSLKDKIIFSGSTLLLSNSHEDIVMRPIEPKNRIDKGVLHVGLMVKEDLMCVIECWEEVKVWVMPERKCIEFLVEYSGECYKLEVQFDDVFEASGFILDGEDNNAVLLKLKYAPKIYQKVKGPDVTSRFKADRYHLCKEDVEFLWVRTTEFSIKKPIGQSSVFYWELVDGSSAPYIFSSIPRYKEDTKDLILEEWEEFSSASGLVPLVKSEEAFKLDYEILFQINSLVHTQKISLAAVDDEFISFLSTLTVDTALILLKKLHKQIHTCYEPLQFIKNQLHVTGQNQQKLPSAESRLLEKNVMSCHRALVTPTKIYLLGPELESSNYVIKHFASYPLDFMRVTFVEEDWGRLHPFVVSTNTQQGIFSKPFRTGVYHRILSVLQEGIVIGEKKFEFLAFSASQLRSNSVWMFASNENKTAEDIRQWMGSFTKIRSISKCAARMGQLFSASKQTLVVPSQDVDAIPDIEVTTDGVDYCFSDGIGKISACFARQVAQKCGLDDTPSAFQIRYGGYKGVIAMDRNSSRKLSLRSSMLKFESPNRMLNVTKWSVAMPCYLNREIVTLLTTLGVPDENLEALLHEQMHFLTNMLTSKEAALAVLASMGMNDSDNILVNMLLHGYEPTAEPYLSMMLQAYRDNQLSDIKNRCRVHVPKGRVVLGCLDETGVLDYGQVFVRLTMRKSELEDREQSYFKRMDEKTSVIVGKVVVTKNPCLHPGDVRVLDAVYDVRLEEKGLVDCLIFPQKGKRPHPNECSGGDLDGDLYFISWDERIIPPRTVAPMDYTARRPRIMDHDVTLEEIQQFFVAYMINDSLGTISTAHLVIADRDPEKALSPKCLLLADLHSMAVDFAKTGAPAEMPRSLKPREYPDFMERYDKPSYVSQGPLGKLYRATVALMVQDRVGPCWSEEMARVTYDPDLEVPGFEDCLEDAKIRKEMYADKMSYLLSFYGAENEDEILTANLRSKSTYLQKDNRRYTEMKDRILESAKSLRREAKEWFKSSSNSESQNQRQKMASAWYHVTYHPSYWEGSINCLSFPWTVGDILITIKSAKMQRNPQIDVI
ncbi:RNA-dependent RNA polymerase 2 [Dionaea muscipula]